jgi:predicted nucleotidyltransferase
VLELPFPYSSSSAEFFASAGVYIADAIGVGDYISFGSESGDITAISEVSEIMLSYEFKMALEDARKNRADGYPKACEVAFKRVSQKDFSFTSNNLLAIEYVKALKRLNSGILPHTIKRMGADYTESDIKLGGYQSAMAIRGSMHRNFDGSISLVPENIRGIISDAYASGEMPTDSDRLSTALISYFRLNPPKQRVAFHDAGDGLYNRLYNANFEANNISDMLEVAERRKSTTARIRRAMWNSFFGVTSSEIKNMPKFTQVLAMDKLGMLLLKNMKCKEGFSVLTKPSKISHFSEEQKKQKDLSDRADSIFELSKPIPKNGKSSLTLTPHIDK